MFCMHNHFCQFQNKSEWNKPFLLFNKCYCLGEKNKMIKGWKNVLEKRIKSFFCENYTTDRYFVKGLFEVMDIKTALLKTIAPSSCRNMTVECNQQKGLKKKIISKNFCEHFFLLFFGGNYFVKRVDMYYYIQQIRI